MNFFINILLNIKKIKKIKLNFHLFKIFIFLFIFLSFPF